MYVHSVWAAAEAYSAPSIVLTSHSHDGLHVFDDFREAYAWLRHNTEVDDKVSSNFTIFLNFSAQMFELVPVYTSIFNKLLGKTTLVFIYFFIFSEQVEIDLWDF